MLLFKAPKLSFSCTNLSVSLWCSGCTEAGANFPCIYKPSSITWNISILEKNISQNVGYDIVKKISKIGWWVGELASNISDNFENRQSCLTIFTKLSKALNCVNHNRIRENWNSMDSEYKYNSESLYRNNTVKSTASYQKWDPTGIHTGIISVFGLCLICMLLKHKLLTIL